MYYFDLLSNLIGLVFWFLFRSQTAGSIQLSKVSIIGNLKPAGSWKFNWGFLLCLILLLGLRGLFYSKLGPDLHWNPSISLRVLSLTFRSDNLPRIMLYSGLSFLFVLGFYLFTLLALSILHSAKPDLAPFHRLVKSQLGWPGKLPVLVQILIPLLLGTGFWWLLQPVLAQLGILPPISRHAELLQQGAVIGLGFYLVWAYFIVVFLAISIVHTFVYVGNFSWLQYVEATSRKLTSPLQWIPLELGKIDFRPAMVMVITFLLFGGGKKALPQLFQQLPFF